MANIDAFVRVSSRNPLYFELTDGSPFIPIGLNLCFVRFCENETDGLRRYETWLRALSQNGGNFFRIWLGHAFFDVEHERSGQYDLEKLSRFDALLSMARDFGLRVKVCLEYFRTLNELQPPFAGAPSFGKPLHHLSRGGPAADMRDFCANPRSRDQFLRKLDWLAARYAGEPAIFGWELWNEMNAVEGDAWQEWTAVMLPELKRRFPNHLVMQSLGGFEHLRDRLIYREIIPLPYNEVSQVHRYLNPGAGLAVCHGPMDVLAADAVGELRALGLPRPILLAETGAVEAHHSGPSKLYEKDHLGLLLHDQLFAPFFSGAAGPGHAWHWDFYVEKQNLWFAFGRFARAVEGIDPRAERFEAQQIPHPRLRVYALLGRYTLLIWCRDPASDWRSVLELGDAPSLVREAVLDLGAVATGLASEVKVYDPWTDVETIIPLQNGQVTLPEFTCSLVVRISRKSDPEIE